MTEEERWDFHSSVTCLLAFMLIQHHLTCNVHGPKRGPFCGQAVDEGGEIVSGGFLNRGETTWLKSISPVSLWDFEQSMQQTFHLCQFVENEYNKCEIATTASVQIIYQLF